MIVTPDPAACMIVAAVVCFFWYLSESNAGGVR